MKKLIIVRHGSYCDNNKCLNEHGLAQMRAIAPKIAEHINVGDKALLLHSTDPRVLMSAEELNKQLKIESKAHDVLVSSGGRLDRSRTLECVRQHKTRADVLILVTHLEYGVYLAPHFELQSLDGTGNNGLEKDHVLIIDWELKV